MLLEDQCANTDAFLVPHDPHHVLSAIECLGTCADSKSDAYDVIDVRLVPDICEDLIAVDRFLGFVGRFAVGTCCGFLRY